MGFDNTQGPVVTFVGGYGQGYETTNPFFDETVAFLRENGDQVLIQPHPKVAPQLVKTTEALAVSEYVIAFNSSVIYDAAVVGKKGIYFYPDRLTIDHFAIQEGYLLKANSKIQLLDTLNAAGSKSAIDLYEFRLRSGKQRRLIDFLQVIREKYPSAQMDAWIETYSKSYIIDYTNRIINLPESSQLHEESLVLEALKSIPVPAYVKIEVLWCTVFCYRSPDEAEVRVITRYDRCEDDEETGKDRTIAEIRANPNYLKFEAVCHLT